MRRIAVVAVLFGITVPGHAEWRKSETRHFTIYSAGKEQPLRNFATKIERFDTMLRARYHVSDADTPQKLTIFMLPTAQAVAKAFGPGGKDLAGFYNPRGEGSMAVVNRENASSKLVLDADAVLFHEYVHHFLTRYFPVAYPAWFSEGFAEFLAPTDFTPEGNAKVGLPAYYRGYSLIFEAAIPVSDMVEANVWDYNSEQRDAFYGRAWMLVHYLTLSGKRVGQLDQYLAAMNAGTPSVEAAKKIFGDLGQLNQELNGYISKSRIGFVQEIRPTPGPTQIDISVVSPAMGATMMQRLLLMRGPSEEEVPALAASLRAAAVSNPLEAAPQLLLAETEYLAGHDAEAVQAADSALKIEPMLSRAMLVKGKAMMRLNIKGNVADVERWKAARGWIVKANKADVNDPMPLFAYYQSFVQQGIAPSDAALAGLRRAYQMVPEAKDVRMTFASSLASQKNYASAIHLVETVAFDPHNGPGSDQARAILKRLHAAQDGKGSSETDLFGDEMESSAGQ